MQVSPTKEPPPSLTLLLPACAGVPKGAASLTDPAMDMLINEYCREAGVRNLKKHLEKVYRKVALKLVKGGNITVERNTAAEDAKGVASPAYSPAEFTPSPAEEGKASPGPNPSSSKPDALPPNEGGAKADVGSQKVKALSG